MATERYRSGNGNLRVSKNRQDLEARQLRALELRIAGKTYNQVAAELKVGYKTAWDDVHEALRIREQELVPIARALEEERIDVGIRAAMRVIEERPGTEAALKAVDRLFRGVALRAQLLGLNAPVEVQVTEVTQLDQEVAALVKEMEQRNQVTRRVILDGETVEIAGEIESGG